MSWSLSFKGTISEVKTQVKALEDPSLLHYTAVDHMSNKHATVHANLFDRAKAALLAEIMILEELPVTEEYSNYITAHFAGHGGVGNSNYSIGIGKMSLGNAKEFGLHPKDETTIPIEEMDPSLV